METEIAALKEAVVGEKTAVRAYENALKKSLTPEAALSGGLGGAIWGSILAAVAGIGLLQFTGIEPFGAATMEGTWGLITLSGLLIGAIMGFLIGLGVSEQDAYLYDASIERGNTMVLLKTTPRRAFEASRIMRQVNLHATSTAAQSGN